MCVTSSRFSVRAAMPATARCVRSRTCDSIRRRSSAKVAGMGLPSCPDRASRVCSSPPSPATIGRACRRQAKERRSLRNRSGLLKAWIDHALEPKAIAAVRGDTFVVETNIHYPTESTLIGDDLRKILPLAAEIAAANGLEGWRQHEHGHWSLVISRPLCAVIES